MGYFTYRNARKAAVRSGRTEKLLQQEARRADGSGYQDAGEIGEDIGRALIAAVVFVALPLVWLKVKLGGVAAAASAVVLIALMVLMPLCIIGYLVWCAVLAFTWREKAPSSDL